MSHLPMTTLPAAKRGDTVVHVLRHGEVHNPEGILYGRRPGFRLSALGQRMAVEVAEALQGRDITHVVASPLERAQQTAMPLAQTLRLELHTDQRLIESANWFEGKRFSPGDNALRHPSAWLRLWNPLRPSWGEPYKEIAARMQAAIEAAAQAAHGHEAVLVSHQLPIWTVRLHALHGSYLHDPRKRQCTLCSVTSFHYRDGELLELTYAEPVGHLVPAKDKKAAFSAGDAPEENKPA